MNEYVAKFAAGILDPGRFDPDSAERSWTLPAEWYYEPEIFRREHEAIFYRTWWYQCHHSDVAEPGDYYCGFVADQEIFIIRGEDGELRAFYNVCSHRAHPLLEGDGNARLIVCPYHQWCYQPDGCFRGARGKDSLKHWSPGNADLKPVRLEVWAGFVFVNLDPDAEPMVEQTGRLLADALEVCPGLDALTRFVRCERPVAANWKTILDNNHECYHCAVNHPSLMELIDYEHRALWSEDGITFSHMIEAGGRKLNKAAYMLDSCDNAEQGSLFGYIWPTLVPLWFPGPSSAVFFQIIPTGPETSIVRHDYYFTNSEPTGQERALVDYIDKVLVTEDMQICERVQKGLHSRGYRQGKFVVDRDHCEYSEHHVHFYQRLVHDALMRG